MIKPNPAVDVYFRRSTKWLEESKKLRKIILGCGLAEELKWGKPCYTVQSSNIVIIQGFKQYIALLFFKGVLLPDPIRILKKTGPNTRVGRQIRFTNMREIIELETILEDYIREAVRVEKAGLKVDVAKNPEPVPEELQKKLDELPALKNAFAALTPGRQRAYILHFSAPKQSKTREARIEKSMRRILNGQGLND